MNSFCDYRSGHWGWLSGLIGMGLFAVWLLILLGFFYLLRRTHGDRGYRSHRFGQASSAMDILKERYAKGEITKDEFDKMKSDVA